MSDSALPKQVDYQRNINHSARYKYLQVLLSNNSTGSFVATSASIPLQWKLPAGVTVNLSKSSISYTLTVAGVASNYTWVADDCFSICNQLTLTTSTGIPIADIPFCNRYTKTVDKFYTRRESFFSRANVDLSYPTNSLASANYIPQIPALAVGVGVNTYGITPNVAIPNGFANYREPQYYVQSELATNLTLSKYVKLGDIGRNTLFEQDKDLYFGDTVYLNFQSAPADAIAMKSNAVNSMGGGLSATAITSSGAITIANIQLNLAVEDNAVLANSVRAKFDAEGINLRTDYLTSVKSLINSVNSNIAITIPQQSNTKLKRIINCVYDSNESLNKMYDSQNLNGCKVLTFQSTMDSQPLQYIFLNSAFSTPGVSANTDYRDNEKFIVGSELQGVPMYQLNWAHIDDFSGDESIKNGNELNESNRDYGLDLDVSRNYLFRCTAPNAVTIPLSQYSFCVLSRTLHMSNKGIMFI